MSVEEDKTRSVNPRMMLGSKYLTLLDNGFRTPKRGTKVLEVLQPNVLI